MFQGRHNGITFRLKIGIEGCWVWEADMPDKQRSGRVFGDRIAAIMAAQRSIDDWSRKTGGHRDKLDTGRMMRVKYGTF